MNRSLPWLAALGLAGCSGMRVVWESLELKRDRNKGWMRVKTRQFNSVPEPARIVLMQGRLFGILPFEGRDPPLSGPFCAAPRFDYPFTDVAGRFPRDYLWIYPALSNDWVALLMATPLLAVAFHRAMRRPDVSLPAI